MKPLRKPIGAPERLNVPFELKAIETLTGDDGAEVGIFEGLASTFGNRDMAGDVVEPGAFAGTLARPGRIKMLWQHDARAPIGVWEKIRETAAGLEVKGRLVLEVQQARETLALLFNGLLPQAQNVSVKMIPYEVFDALASLEVYSNCIKTTESVQN